MQTDKDITLMKYKPEAKEIHILQERRQNTSNSPFSQNRTIEKQKTHTDLHCQKPWMFVDRVSACAQIIL